MNLYLHNGRVGFELSIAPAAPKEPARLWDKITSATGPTPTGSRARTDAEQVPKWVCLEAVALLRAEDGVAVSNSSVAAVDDQLATALGPQGLPCGHDCIALGVVVTPSAIASM